MVQGDRESGIGIATCNICPVVSYIFPAIEYTNLR